jgi:hypothetical protein
LLKERKSLWKWLAVTAGVIILLFVAAYLLLFTSPGNKLLTPVIEKRISAATELPATLAKFELRPGRFALTLFLSPDNRVEAAGSFAIFGRELKATYRVFFDDLPGLQPLTKTTLYGRLRTDGIITGRFADLLITGSSAIAAGKTTYSVKLVSFAPSGIKARIVDAEAAQLLAIVGRKPFSSANISLDADIRDIDPQNLDGELVLAVTRGRIDTALMNKEFDLTLPKTTYTMQASSHLQGREISYKVSLESNLAHLLSEGTLAPESLRIDLKYEVDAKELALFKALTDSPLRGPFKTSGTVKGDRRKMAVAGVADIGGGRTDYDITLEELKVRRVLVKMDKAELAKLLYMAGQPEFATGAVNVDLTLTNLDPENMQGEAVVKIGKGELVSSVFKKEYDITLPQTLFTCDLNANLQGREIDYRTRFESNLAKIGSEGAIIPRSMGMDLSYRADIEKLGLLQPFVGMPLRGALQLNGTAKGDRELLNVAGVSDLAGGKITFQAGLKDFAPANITAKIKDLQLAKMLNLLAKPHYADGVLNVDINIPNAKTGELEGTVTSEISRGQLDGKVIAQEFELEPIPKTTFTAKTRTTLAGNLIDTTVTLKSTIADLNSKRLRYDLDASLLTGDYRADIPDLDRLYFVAGRHLKGQMTVTGDLEKGERFKLTAHADTLGGRIDATVLDDDVHSDLKKIQTLDTLKMLTYPEILAATLDGTLAYNLERKKGTFSAKLSEGKFTRNIMLDLLLMAKTDLYKERFIGNLHSRINEELISSDLELRSNSSTITGKKMALNSKTKVIDARLDVLANNNPIGVTIKGKADKPEVKLDTSALIKKEAGKVIQKELDKLLKGLFK